MWFSRFSAAAELILVRVKSIMISVSVCISVGLSASISQKPDVQISPIFPYAVPVAVARSSPDGNAINYVLPVFWMTLYFRII